MKKIAFFDLETQYTFQELGMLDWKSRDPSKLKLAVAGILSDGKISFFRENQINELIESLKKSDIIIGHNLIRFDYLVLLNYIEQNAIDTLGKITFDTWADLERLTNSWVSLDDLCKRNLGISKTFDPLKIPKMWRDGMQNEVIDYLANDLKMTESIFNHGKNTGKLKYEHKDYGRSLGEKEVNVDWNI
ncbi:MAG: DEAD/DEAH box helicase [archaeon GW2011_AR5]|nr:MAG: DEAD/DEAH box helicase [archaeon GW2011_AR5]